MPKLVCREGKSRKFWHGWVDGLELNLRFGPLGGTAQQKRKEFPSHADAEKELAKLVKQKLAKGYADETRTIAFDESPLELRELVDPPLPTLDDASLAHEDAGLDDGWSETFWRGDYAFAGSASDETARAGLIDRLGKRARFRKFEPEIVGASFCGNFDHTATRVAVCSPKAPVYLVETKSFPAGIVVVEYEG